MLRRHLLAIATTVSLWGGAAIANDSSAALAAGGLVLTKDQNIEMRSEDLVISTKEVRVTYRFLNTAPRPVTTLVAFPMPDIVMDEEGDMSIPTDDPENLLAFTTRVDGRPVPARLEQRAFVGRTEYTTFLKRLGVPLAPHIALTRDALDRLPTGTQKELVRVGLARIDEYDAGKGMERHLQPIWTLKTKYWWEQTFPAGREITVEHRYKPAVGGSAGSLLGTSFGTPEDRRAMAAKYCMDQAFLAAAQRATRANGDNISPFFEQHIEYILTTGGNWKKPIGDFRLTVDKGYPDSLLSFCGDGVRKISPTRFEMRRQNFRPTKDLSILILERPRG